MSVPWSKKHIHNDEDDWDIDDYLVDEDNAKEPDDEETTIVIDIDEKNPKIGKWW